MRHRKPKTHTPKSKPKAEAKKREAGRLADSMQAAAAQMGYSIEALKAAKRAGCKAFKAGSRVDIFELEEWFALNPEIQSVVDSKLTVVQAITMEKVSKALQRRDAYATQRRELIRADEMRRTFARFVVATKNKLLAIPSSLSPTLALLKDVPEIDAALRKTIMSALKELSENEWAKLICPRCKKDIEIL